MMKPSHLAAQGAGLLGRSLREVAYSLAAGVWLLGLAVYSFWLHLVLGALLLTKLVIGSLGPRPRAARRPRPGAGSER